MASLVQTSSAFSRRQKTRQQQKPKQEQQQKQKLEQIQEQQQQQQQQQNQKQQPAEAAKPAESEPDADNPVGKLQEFCQKHLWPLPAYAYESSGDDNPSRRQFTCTVSLRDQSARGSGRSKRQAKRAAAGTLLERLRNDSSEQKAASSSQQPPQPPAQESIPTSTTPTQQSLSSGLDETCFQQLRTSKRLQSAAKAGSEVGGLFQGLRNRKAGAALPPLETPAVSESGSSACEQLQELSRTHRFGLQFLPAEEHPVSANNGGAANSKNRRQHRAVVKLSTMPTIVAVGSGRDATEAREQACQAAMEYLCSLTRETAAKK